MWSRPARLRPNRCTRNCRRRSPNHRRAGDTRHRTDPCTGRPTGQGPHRLRTEPGGFLGSSTTTSKPAKPTMNRRYSHTRARSVSAVSRDESVRWRCRRAGRTAAYRGFCCTGGPFGEQPHLIDGPIVGRCTRWLAGRSFSATNRGRVTASGLPGVFWCRVTKARPAPHPVRPAITMSGLHAPAASHQSLVLPGGHSVSYRVIRIASSRRG